MSAAFSDAINLRANILDGCQMPKREQEVLGGVGQLHNGAGGTHNILFWWVLLQGGGMFVVLWA